MGTPTFDFPRTEDIAIVISLIQDPSSTSSFPSLAAFDIVVFQNGKFISSRIGDSDDKLIMDLAELITMVSENPSLTVQIFCYSWEETYALNQILVQKALTTDSPDLHICIGAILSIPLALLTSIQPELLDNVLYRSWSKVSRPELEVHLASLGLETEGDLKSLQTRLKDAMTSDNPSLRRLPKVISLQKALEKILAMPGPGFTKLENWAWQVLGPCNVPSDEELYTLVRNEDEIGWKVKLRAKTEMVFRIVVGVRKLLEREYEDIGQILVNEARPLSPSYIQLCQDPNLRKLLFMHEVSALHEYFAYA